MGQEEDDEVEVEVEVEVVVSKNGGLHLKAADVDSNAEPEPEPAKELDDGNILEAESSLREGLSLNYEEARALLGRLEYQRGNVEAAFRVFDGIDLHTAVQRLQSSLSADTLKPALASRRGRKGSDPANSTSASQHAASLVLEAIYLKAMSLQKLQRPTEAAQECRSVLDAVEQIFQHGIPDVMVDQKLQEIVSRAVELLPELYKQAARYPDALSSYRRALLSQWNLDDECLARIQKRFAVFLLYSGVEATPPSLAYQSEGSFVPKNNLEEAILLLMILLRKWYNGRTKWDPAVMEHLTFALSVCGQTNVLAQGFEELWPGTYPRTERWYTLALCYSGSGQNEAALNLLRKCLNRHESPDDMSALLLAAKICSDCGSNHSLASEGMHYAKRAVKISENATDKHVKGMALRYLGRCQGKTAKLASSDHERSLLQTEALKSLSEAVLLEKGNPDLVYDLGLENAKQRNINAALKYAKDYIDLTGGSVIEGWRFLAMVLSAQGRYSEAEVVADAALDETAKWDQGPLLRIKAKLKVSQSHPLDAVEAYRMLLALVQAQRKSASGLKNGTEVSEDEVWQDLANLYAKLSHWRDAEVCLQKATSLKPFSASALHTQGSMHEAQESFQDALASYAEGLSMNLNHAACKVSIGALLSKRGPKCLPVSRSFLSDALRLEPTNCAAWYYLGMVHRDDGRPSDAADCFQAAAMLEESDPVESFSMLS